MGRRHPDAVPVAVLAVAAGVDQRVVARAAGIDLEDVARAAVEKRVEDDLDVVLVAQRAVALLREGDDIAGFGIVTDHADQDFSWPHQETNHRRRRWHVTLTRLDHRNGGDRFDTGPCRFVEQTIETIFPGRSDAKRRHLGRLPRGHSSGQSMTANTINTRCLFME